MLEHKFIVSYIGAIDGWKRTDLFVKSLKSIKNKSIQKKQEAEAILKNINLEINIVRVVYSTNVEQESCPLQCELATCRTER